MMFKVGAVLQEHIENPADISEVLLRRRGYHDYGWNCTSGNNGESRQELKAPCIIKTTDGSLYHVSRGTPTYDQKSGDAILIMSDESIVRVKNPYRRRGLKRFFR